ncbi:Alpha-ketoglutarate-dependent dioxygenase alkB 2 [Rhizophlyctis rosea]|uniref:Alpha-ketoglutarate-dependent dioxygenase alkB 2 n=1 Tax=Rhizophlyctis rosea TaxID=64517 RepID=A0AAD5S771_9FUNG|nr:Alpha-ketoglutarate-dependent dioxygenase alkB 2 [Rhizophlyctis rosea]
MFDSQYIPDFLTRQEADLAYGGLQNELVYVPREKLVFNIYGKTFQLPRDKAFHGDVAADGSYPLYRYGGDWYPPVLPWTPTLRHMRDLVHQRTGQFCNHVVVNRYVNGKDHIGFHHDKTRDFEPDSYVCTVSFGGTRRLVLQDANGQNESINIEHGSMFLLGAVDNANYKHKIAKTSTQVDTRISLTFRNIRTRADANGNLIG